jgi:hypothetical protein
VADLNILELRLGLLERYIQSPDAVAGITIDALDSPLTYASPNKIADVHGHGEFSDRGERDRGQNLWLNAAPLAMVPSYLREDGRAAPLGSVVFQENDG